MVSLGPIQKEDELLLTAVIRMTCPKKAVELGYLQGYSARLILSALNSDSKLVSYDNSTVGYIDDRRFEFKNKSQTDYDEKDVDFLFFDASHDLVLNQITFNKAVGGLNDGAIVAIHDTGLWNQMIMDTGGKWIGGGYAHRLGEREFVNWIKEKYPEFQIINFHTLNETRHGMTLLQKYGKLLTC